MNVNKITVVLKCRRSSLIRLRSSILIWESEIATSLENEGLLVLMG